MLSPNRVVVVLSPVFVGLAGWIADLAAQYLPGHPQLDPSELAAVFILGATLASAKVLLWLRGWQVHEARTATAPSPGAAPASP